MMVEAWIPEPIVAESEVKTPGPQVILDCKEHNVALYEKSLSQRQE